MEIHKKMADEMLVTLYANGENQAFNVLIDRYRNRLYSYIFYIVRSTELTEDIFQEALMKAIVTIRQGRYNENGKFPAWLTRIAHNLIIDHFRQEKNENQISCDDSDMNILNNIRLAEAAVENEMVSNQILSDVRKLTDFLPDEQREVIRMRFYQDLSFKEIAELTGVSINTSLGRMRYAILNLRRMVQTNGVFLG